MNKSKLYESIMKSVSKTVKRELNENDIPKITNIITQVFKSNCNNNKALFLNTLGILFGYELLKCSPDSVENNEDIFNAIKNILRSNNDKMYIRFSKDIKSGNLNSLAIALSKYYMYDFRDINILVNKFNLVDALSNTFSNPDKNEFLYGFFYYIFQYSKVLKQKVQQIIINLQQKYNKYNKTLKWDD